MLLYSLIPSRHFPRAARAGVLVLVASGGVPPSLRALLLHGQGGVLSPLLSGSAAVVPSYR